MSRPRRWLWVLAPVVGLGLHCGASSSPSSLADDGGVSPTKPGDGSKGLDADRLSDPEAGAVEVGSREPPPSLESVLSDGVLIVNASSWFPAFRICPAAPGAVEPVSDGAMAPIPTALMPSSSLAGVDVQGAVRIRPNLDFDGKQRVVLLKIDGTTKDRPALASGACAALACSPDAGGSACLGFDNLKLVSLPDPGLLNKAGTILVLEDDGPTGVRFVTRTAANGPPASAGGFDVQLLNESGFDGGVQYFASATGDGGTAARALDIPSKAPSTTRLPYVDFAGELAAGAHRETLLDVHASSAPRTPIADFYASPGAFALVLVGRPTDAGEDAGRSLKFLAIPMRLSGSER